MKLPFGKILIMLTLPHVASAQAFETATSGPRHQVTVQVGANFTRKVTDPSGITYKPTSSGAALIGYRFNIIRWLGVEADYDLFRNTQKFITTGSTTAFKTNVNVATGSLVFNLPNPLTKRIQSFASLGGGAMIFNQNGTDFNALETRNVIVVGGGLDIPVAPHIAIRGQAKTFLYKAPDFTISNLRTTKYVQTMVPSVGVVFSF
jgi:hypothetical protein